MGGSFGAAQGQTDARPLDALAIALLLVGPVGVALSRRWLTYALPVAAAAMGVWLALGYPYGPIFASYAVLTIIAVSRGRRWLAWGSALLPIAGQLVRGLDTDRQGSWGGVGGFVAWLIVAFAVAEVVRGRRDRAAAAWAARREALARREGEERLLIAQELHDVVAHHMSLINVQAGVALHLGEREKPEHVEPALRAIRDASGEALAELRSLVDVLRSDHAPAPRAPTVRLAALGDLVSRSRAAGLDITVKRLGAQRELPAAVDLAAYRIVQEAITNVVRHAYATHATVTLDHDTDLTVTIEDNGHGPDPATLIEGNGISGMRERAHALGGTVALDPSPLGGLQVRANFPLAEGSSS
ncbi:histidine kinase [Knoellia subterranea KCTC 19937]|uniref:histidine kinase n=1 Tax=Knoellia subterranea KCTC 19937 TaxID=1385521 RepID=A0A0A0JPX7_9MICO|nr:histidine kinase [Knoellia subterranea KCTC 19937]